MNRPFAGFCLGLLPFGLVLAAVPAKWTRPAEPFRIAGNTWYVGTEGITVLLVRGRAGSILIDSGVDAALPALQRNLARVGVAPEEIDVILTSHAHVDHTGAVAALQAWTGARVLASAESATLLAAGGRGDLHFGDELPYPAVRVHGTLVDGEEVALGELRLTMHLTPGHTPGSSTWTWTERHEGRDVAMVYADSVTAPGYRLLDHPHLPDLVPTFRSTFAKLRALPCDVLITPHPEASDLFVRVGPAAVAERSLAEPGACARYADRAESALEQQAAEQAEAATLAKPGDGK